MWAIGLSILLIAGEFCFLVAYFRRVRGMPLSQRRTDRRAWYYGLGFLILNLGWAVVGLVGAVLNRPK